MDWTRRGETGEEEKEEEGERVRKKRLGGHERDNTKRQ